MKADNTLMLGTLIPSLAGSALVLPSIAIGNVSQLTADLLIHTFNLTKVEALDDSYLYPFSSPMDYTEGKDKRGIALPIEVYHGERSNLTVVQQRSPIIPSYTKAYIEEVLLPFIKSHDFSAVYVLDSFDAGLVEKPAGIIDVVTSDDFLNASLLGLSVGEDEAAADYSYSFYSRLLLKLVQQLKINVNVLVSYVYEGDNFNDAELFANKLAQILNLGTNITWVRPVSWLGVYGDKPVANATEDGLYG